jgi:hypothetical protein
MYKFADCMAEGVLTKQAEPPRRGKRKTRTSTSREDMNPDQLAYSVQRARREMRHKCLMLQTDRMITLTYRSNFTDRDAALKHYDHFAKLCRRHFRSFEYVAVTERQKRGAIHFHIAVNRFYSVNKLRALWQQVIGEDGQVNITKPTPNPKAGAGYIARYMSKYMSKDMQDIELSRKRYTSSRGIAKPEKITLYIPIGPNTFQILARLTSQYIGKSYDRCRRIDGAERYILWFTTF